MDVKRKSKVVEKTRVTEIGAIKCLRQQEKMTQHKIDSIKKLWHSVCKTGARLLMIVLYRDH